MNGSDDGDDDGRGSGGGIYGDAELRSPGMGFMGWAECIGVVMDDENVSTDAAAAGTLAMARGIANIAESSRGGAVTRHPWDEVSTAAAAARARHTPKLRVQVGLRVSQSLEFLQFIKIAILKS